jgi:hypothetical protein
VRLAVSTIWHARGMAERRVWDSVSRLVAVGGGSNGGSNRVASLLIRRLVRAVQPGPVEAESDKPQGAAGPSRDFTCILDGQTDELPADLVPALETGPQVLKPLGNLTVMCHRRRFSLARGCGSTEVLGREAGRPIDPHRQLGNRTSRLRRWR